MRRCLALFIGSTMLVAGGAWGADADTGTKSMLRPFVHLDTKEATSFGKLLVADLSLRRRWNVALDTFC